MALQSQKQQSGRVDASQHPILTPDDYIVNDATVIPGAIYNTLQRLYQDPEVMHASAMIQRNPHGTMNAAARFERLLTSAEEWVNDGLSNFSVFERACIWHGLVHYRTRLAGLQLSDSQSSSTSPQQDIISEHYLPWHAPKITSDDCIWPADSLVLSPKLRENVQTLFMSSKRLQNQLTPLAVHTLPYLMKKNVMICSGSYFEKTLALAIGVVDFVARLPSHPSAIAPKALILVPSHNDFLRLHYYLAELAHKTHDLKIKIGGISTWNHTTLQEVNTLKPGIDIMLSSTPGKLERLDYERHIDWSQLALLAFHGFDEMADHLDPAAQNMIPPASVLDPVRGSIGRTARARGTHYSVVATCERSPDHGALLALLKSLMFNNDDDDVAGAGAADHHHHHQNHLLYHISVGCPAYDIPNITHHIHKISRAAANNMTTVSHLAQTALAIIQQQQQHDANNKTGATTSIVLWSTGKRAAEAHRLFLQRTGTQPAPAQPRPALRLVHAGMPEASRAAALRDYRRRQAGSGGGGAVVVLNTTVDLVGQLRCSARSTLVIHADLPPATSSDLYPAWYKWFDASISAGKTLAAGAVRHDHTLLPEGERAMARGMAQVLRDYRKRVPEVLDQIAGDV